MREVIIIGAGPAGLCAAKTIQQLEPQKDILLVDAQSSIGGVWAKEKLYPTLKTNNIHPNANFSDFHLPPSFGIEEGQHLTGEAMHGFLKAYADHWKLTDKIWFGVTVLEISRLDKDNGWQLKVKSQSQTVPDILECLKLIVAVGSTNSPHWPSLKGTDAFEAPIIHTSNLGRHTELVRDVHTKTVAVLGGGKSAYDAVHLAATSGKKVEWIIRKSGRGPAWVFPAHTYLGPFRAGRERLVSRRILSFMSPCIWRDGFEWARSFLHFNELGKKIAQKFWQQIHADTIRDCGFQNHKLLNVLEPETSPFWYGTASGVNSYQDEFYSFILNGRVRIHREDVSHLSSRTIHLGNSETLSVDALIAATGFSAKPTMTFAPSSIQDCSGSRLGIPCTNLDPVDRAMWQQLDAASDNEIGTKFPRLLVGPHLSPSSTTAKSYNLGSSSEAEAKYSPWRLYRSIAPPGLTARGDRSLVFIGMFSNIANTIRLEIQCLWAAAYLFGQIPSLEEDARKVRVFQETSLSQRYTQLRSPFGHGRFIPDLVFDQLPYWDMLLRDLGLETRRKSGWRNGLLGWLGLRELFEPYTAEDYRGIVLEWLQKKRKM